MLTSWSLGGYTRTYNEKNAGTRRRCFGRLESRRRSGGGKEKKKTFWQKANETESVVYVAPKLDTFCDVSALLFRRARPRRQIFATIMRKTRVFERGCRDTGVVGRLRRNSRRTGQCYGRRNYSTNLSSRTIHIGRCDRKHKTYYVVRLRYIATSLNEQNSKEKEKARGDVAIASEASLQLNRVNSKHATKHKRHKSHQVQPSTIVYSHYRQMMKEECCAAENTATAAMDRRLYSAE